MKLAKNIFFCFNMNIRAPIMNINSLRSFKNSVPPKMKEPQKIVAYTSLAVASFAVAMPKAFNEVKKIGF